MPRPKSFRYPIEDWAAFRVLGNPAPKGSRTSGTRKDGSRYSRPACAREKPWAMAVQLAAFDHIVAFRPDRPVMKPPYRISLRFYIDQPKRPKFWWPTSNGDLDKITRCTVDGLTFGGLLVDDRHVIALHVEQEYKPGPGWLTGCVVTVSSPTP